MPFFLHWGRRLAEVVDVPPAGRLLDVATGRGAVLFAAAERAALAVGIDLSEPMIQLTAVDARSRAMRQVHGCRMDAESLGFADQTFDRVTCGFVVRFLPHVRTTFAEVFRVLRPGGSFSVSIGSNVSGQQSDGLIWELLQRYRRPRPNTPEQRALWQLPWADRQARGVLSWPSGQELEQVLLECGFCDVHSVTEEADLVAGDEEEWWSWQWSHMPRFDLEQLAPDAAERLKAEAFEKLRSIKRPDGIHLRAGATLTLATRPHPYSR